MGRQQTGQHATGRRERDPGLELEKETKKPPSPAHKGGRYGGFSLGVCPRPVRLPSLLDFQLIEVIAVARQGERICRRVADIDMASHHLLLPVRLILGDIPVVLVVKRDSQ